MSHLSPSLRALLELPAPQRRIGPFLLIEQLGSGGFAPVWLAKEVHGTRDLRTAAVKLFSFDLEDSEGSESAAQKFRAQVVNEAHALCQVEHPCIVRFYALPADETRKIIGLAMEHVDGTPLNKRIEKGKLPVAEVLGIGTMLASALAAVHRAGLVHRDVKPANVVESGGVYKLIDFGIAAAESAHPARGNKRKMVVYGEMPFLGTDDASTTRMLSPQSEEHAAAAPLKLAGTMGYVDPEVLTGISLATAASDIYSLGVLLFQCLTGKLPASFSKSPGRPLDMSILTGRTPSPPLCEVEPAIPAPLGRLIDRMLSRTPRDRPRSAEIVAAELDRLRSGLADAKRELPPEDVGPFRGLRRFEEGDRDVYFGRGGEIIAALDMLRTRGLVALVGPSGSGKSSLARAGVLPRVAEGALGGWPRQWDVVVPPEGDPRQSIAGELARLKPPLERAADLDPDALMDALAERAVATERGVLLLVDQLEELAATALTDEARWTLDLLALIGERASPGVRAIVTVRRDLLDPVLSHKRLGKALLRGTLLVAPMDDAAWGNVVDQALSVYGYSFEDDRLREELETQLRGTSSAMPLVQFALTELWRKRDTQRRKITRDGLKTIGGIAGALERHANATLARIEVAHPQGRGLARDVLLALTSPQGTRMRRTLKEIERTAGAGAADVIAMLERARLIVREADGVTLAHEALLAQWGTLSSWLAEARQDRLLAEELDHEAARFRADDSLALPRGRRLYAAEEMIRRGRVPVSAEAAALVKAGRRAWWQVRLLAGAAGAVVLAGVITWAWIYVQGITRAKAEADRATEAAERNRRQAEESRSAEERARRQAEEALKTAEQSREKAERAEAVAQAQLKTIDELLQDLKNAPDPRTVAALKEELQKARQAPVPTVEPTAEPPLPTLSDWPKANGQ